MENAFQHILGAEDLIADRSFTHTDNIPKDRKVLVHMANQVCRIMESNFESLKVGKPLFVDEPDGRWHRYLIPRPIDLLQAEMIYLVGFFGQKHAEISPDYLAEYSDRLTERIPSYPEILSYSTMALPNGDFSNLVLLSNEEIKLKWLGGETHNQAVKWSPKYYLSLRINNGVLAQGVLKPDTLQITVVKYCDYRDSPPWKAMRLLF